MKQKLDPFHSFALRSDVSALIDNNNLVLSSKRESFIVDSGIPLDLEKLIQRSRLEIKDNADATDEFIFAKFIKHLINISWVTIKIHEGIVLEACTPSTYDLLFTQKKSDGPFFLIPGVLIETSGNHLLMTDPKAGTIICLETKILAEILINENLDASVLLWKLGMVDLKEADSFQENLIDDAFHFRTTSALNVIKNPAYTLSKPWSGQPQEISFESDEFLKTLKLRQSNKREKGRLISLKELKEFLQIVYGARIENGKLKFSYPSPGAGYSLRLKIVYPAEGHDKILIYDPVNSTLTECGHSQAPHSTSGLIKIYLCGSLSELRKRYQSITYRLLLLEAGVLLQQLSLCSSYKNLNSWIIGFTNEKAVKNSFSGAFAEDELLVGEFTITGKDL